VEAACVRARNIVLLLVLALILVACQNGTSSSDKRTATPAATKAPVATVTQTAIEPSPAGASSASSGVHCGTERWPVKTLSDADAGLVNFTRVPATVSSLVSLPKPSSLPSSSRIVPTELTVYTVTARLVEFKQEDDRDIHLVIADPTDASQTMIVEFPDAQNCSGAVGSAHGQEMRDARAAFVAAFGQPPSSSFRQLSGVATVTGVAFFDFLHGQTGVAPNGIELHPVLGFTATGSSGPPPAPAVPVSTPVAANGVDYPCEAGDCNCADFPSHAEAQRVFEKHGGGPANNWSGLDRDHDGIACEALP